MPLTPWAEPQDVVCRPLGGGLHGALHRALVHSRCCSPFWGPGMPENPWGGAVRGAMGSPRRAGSAGWAGTLGLSCPPPYQGQLCSGGLAWTLPWGLELQFSTAPRAAAEGWCWSPVGAGGSPEVGWVLLQLQRPHWPPPTPLNFSAVSTAPLLALPPPPRSPFPPLVSPLSPAAQLLGTWSESFLLVPWGGHAQWTAIVTGVGLGQSLKPRVQGTSMPLVEPSCRLGSPA